MTGRQGGSGQPVTVSIVGSTGSIGTQAIDVIGAEPDRFRVVALGAWSSGRPSGRPGPSPPTRRRGHRRPVVGAGIGGLGATGHRDRHRSRGAGLHRPPGPGGGECRGRVRRTLRHAGRPGGRASAGAGQQGVPDRRGTDRPTGPADPGGGDRPRRLRALCPAPVLTGRPIARRGGPAPAHGQWGTVPGADPGRVAGGHRGGGTGPSHLADGSARSRSTRPP